MTYIYYIDGEKFTTDTKNEIPRNEISSPDEITPALENLSTGVKIWGKKGFIWHRLTGPGIILSDGKKEFYLNDKCYFRNVKDWLADHPNQDNAFQVEMLLKYS